MGPYRTCQRRFDLLDQRDGFAGDRLVDVDEAALPLDLAAAALAAALGVVRTGRLAQHAVPGAGGRTVVLGRGVVIERGMRALELIDQLEVAKPLDLTAQVRRWRARRLLFERQMQTLTGGRSAAAVPASMRSGRRPALIARTEGRERPTAPVEANWRPVVRAQRHGQAMLAQGEVHDRPDMVGIGARHRLAAQKVSAVRIRQGQGLAPRPVAGPEPALEIDAPHVVGTPRTRQTAPCAAARAGATGASPSNPRDPTRPRSCSPPASQRPDRDAAARPAPSPDPNSDAPAEPTGTRPQSPPTTTAHAGAVTATGTKAPKHRPADSAQTTCNRPDGSH